MSLDAPQPEHPPGSLFTIDDSHTVPRGHVLMAWLVIVAVLLLSLGVIPLGEEAADRAPAAEQPPQGLEVVQDRIQELLGKYLVAAAQFDDQNTDEVLAQLRDQDRGSTLNKLRNVALAGELAGPQRALDELAKVEADKPDLSRDAQATWQTLERLYLDYADQDWAASNVDAAARKALVTHLGWFGDLALTPEEGPNQAAREALLADAQASLALTFMAMLLGLSILGAGFIAAITLFVLMMSGSLQSRVATGSPAGGIYAETFALWLVLFIGSSLMAGELIVEEQRFVASLAIFFGSLAALAWPVMRGVPWSTVRADIGWSRGAGVVPELSYGVLTYLATLPALIVAVMLIVLLSFLQAQFFGGDGPGGVSPPSHPIVDWIVNAPGHVRLQLVLLACVAAPIVEETMFRGVLYRHLRELTSAAPLVLSVLVAAIASGVVFALLHPQGPIALPALATLAVSFALARQWRGSLIAPVVAHAVNNGLVTLALLSLL